MKILILSSPHPYFAAGIVATDLFTELKKIEGYEVKMLVNQWGEFHDKNIISAKTKMQEVTTNFIRKAKKALVKFKIIKANTTAYDYHFLEYDQTKTHYNTEDLLNKVDFHPDVIIALFMYNFISYKTLYEMEKLTSARVYLYPMDMAPFTGGCHYAWECKGYTKECGICPALYSSVANDQSNKNVNFKKFYIQKSAISLFSANKQMTKQIQSSAIFNSKKIHEGIFPLPNPKIFYSKGRDLSREHFKINTKKMIFFIGACSLNEKRKGMGVLLDSLDLIAKKKSEFGKEIYLLIAGDMNEEMRSSIPFEYYCLGFTKDFEELAFAYCAADYYISSSVEDSGPTMVLQSILCETPVISFDIGYAKDFIVDEINGFKAMEKTSLAFSKSIYRAIIQGEGKYIQMKNQLRILSGSLSAKNAAKRIHEILTNS